VISVFASYMSGRGSVGSVLTGCVIVGVWYGAKWMDRRAKNRAKGKKVEGQNEEEP
jgi:hypothetical protein